MWSTNVFVFTESQGLRRRVHSSRRALAGNHLCVCVLDTTQLVFEIKGAQKCGAVSCLFIHTAEKVAISQSDAKLAPGS